MTNDITRPSNMLKDNCNQEKTNSIGIGMDSAVIPLAKHGLSLIQTVDFFYPLIDDPYIMGKSSYAKMVYYFN